MSGGYAIEMDGYGGPEVLRYRPVTWAPLQPDEVRIKTLAAAINHTDLKIRAGLWPIRKAAPFPYTPGVEVVGEVMALGSQVRGLALGDRVITMMQGLGGVRAERAGGYAEQVTVAQDSLARLDPKTDPRAAAAQGLAAVTALEGLRRIGDLAGKTILVTGAAGGVGAAAVALAHAAGARVYAGYRGADQAQALRDLGAEGLVRIDPDRPEDTAFPPLDGALDTVGAPLFAPILRALRAGGCLSVVGAVGGSAVQLDLWDLIAPITLTGYSSEALDGATLRRAMAQIETLPPPPYHCFALAEAAKAHAALEARQIGGRVLLIP